jgi:hypothetical protein
MSGRSTISAGARELSAAGNEMRFLILGYGKFGRIALERVRRAFPGCETIIVESDATRTADLRAQDVQIHTMEAVAFLVSHPELQDDDIVIPMVPFHLAAAFLLAVTPRCAETPLPEHITDLVPNPWPVRASTVCCSVADFLCPDDCPEGDRCTVTGEARDPLHDVLAALNIPGWSVVALRSFQILPGVGGYMMGELRALQLRLGGGRYLIATSCKCHGTVTALQMIEP